MHHQCVYKYSSTRAILVPSERVIRAHAARVAKTCQILGKVETPGTQRTACGVSARAQDVPATSTETKQEARARGRKLVVDSYDGDDVMMTIRATLVSCVCLCEDKVDAYDLQKEHVPVVRFFFRREATYSFVAKVSSHLR